MWQSSVRLEGLSFDVMYTKLFIIPKHEYVEAIRKNTFNATLSN